MEFFIPSPLTIYTIQYNTASNSHNKAKANIPVEQNRPATRRRYGGEFCSQFTRQWKNGGMPASEPPVKHSPVTVPPVSEAFYNSELKFARRSEGVRANSLAGRPPMGILGVIGENKCRRPIGEWPFSDGMPAGLPRATQR